jgi:hypothetical protein
MFLHVFMYLHNLQGVSSYVCRICKINKINKTKRGFGGLEVACWPLVPKVAGSNPGEAVGFFRAKKSLAHLPSEGQ